MANDLSEQQTAVLDDLLREKNLWTIYQRSRAIKFSKLNLICGFVAFVACLIACSQAKSATALANHIASLSTASFSTGIGLLGFLLAGFSFFATVGDKRLFFRMAEIPHDDSGLSYLKYNFFTFMRVFIEYLVFTIVTLGLMVAFDKESGTRQWLATTYGKSELAGLPADKAGTAIMLSALFGSLVYLLMQLKSFIFNVYHIVMTSIQLELQDEYLPKAVQGAKPPVQNSDTAEAAAKGSAEE